MKNVDIKNVITIVALILWIGVTAYGCFISEFNTVFDFFKECFLMVISFYLGTKSKAVEQSEEA